MINFLGTPTVEFCEKAGIGLIKRPFYAISNLVYLFSGLIILKKGRGSVLSKAFGYTSILIGLLSFLYDASYTYISQLADLLGMFIFVSVLIYFSAKRYFDISHKRLMVVQFLSVVCGIFLVVYFKSYAGEFVFGAFIVTEIILEYLLWKKGKAKNIRLWCQALGVFAIGFILWLPDATGMLCDPHDYINGRSLFHLSTAVTIYMLYLYYELQVPTE